MTGFKVIITCYKYISMAGSGLNYLNVDNHLIARSKYVKICIPNWDNGREVKALDLSPNVETRAGSNPAYPIFFEAEMHPYPDYRGSGPK